MAYLEINGTIIHLNDITNIEEKRVVAKATAQVDNPKPKLSKGVFAKLLYSDTIEETVELEYTVVVLKAKNGTQITTNVDDNTGAVENCSHQLYDFYAVCGDSEFLKAMSCVISNKKDVELEMGNFYCYPGMLQHSDYMNTNVVIDADIQFPLDNQRPPISLFYTMISNVAIRVRKPALLSISLLILADKNSCFPLRWQRQTLNSRKG